MKDCIFQSLGEDMPALVSRKLQPLHAKLSNYLRTSLYHELFYTPIATRIRNSTHTPDEVEQLTIAAGKFGRHRHRDRTLILVAFWHALRVSEQVALR